MVFLYIVQVFFCVMVSYAGETTNERQVTVLGHWPRLSVMRTYHGVSASPLLCMPILIGNIERGPIMVWFSKTDDDTMEWYQVAEKMLTRHWIPHQDIETCLFLYSLLYLAG